MTLLSKRPVLAMRTRLDVSRILTKLVRAVPEESLFQVTSGIGLVGRDVRPDGFTLRCSDGEDAYLVVGRIRESKHERLILVRFEPDRAGWKVTAAAVPVLAAIFIGTGLMTWQAAAALALLSAASAILKLRYGYVPTGLVREVGERLRQAFDAELLPR